MTTHDFRERLDFSHRLADAPWWEPVYRRAFPDFVTMVDLRQDGWHQRAGRDRAIVLSTGRTLYVDEKGREKDWPDVAVEIWSQYPKGQRQARYPRRPGAIEGWSRKPLDCDFLAYAFVPSRRCHLFPFLGVRAAVVKHGAQWGQEAASNFESSQRGQRPHTGLRWIHSPNRSYDTISLGVPLAQFLAAINDALTITWTEADEGQPLVPHRRDAIEDEDPWAGIEVRKPPDREVA